MGLQKRGVCGVEIVLLIKQDNSIFLWMGVGLGTNNRAELLALWGLLHFSMHRGIVLQYVMGDSKVIIDWALHRQSFQSLSVHH